MIDTESAAIYEINLRKNLYCYDKFYNIPFAIINSNNSLFLFFSYREVLHYKSKLFCHVLHPS